MSEQAAKNTDRELWRGPDKGAGSYYADSIHVTEGGGIGINVGGHAEPSTFPPHECIWRTDLDNAPRDGTQILPRWRTDVFDVISWIEGDWMDGESRVSAPTHWRPIEPPHFQEETV